MFLLCLSTTSHGNICVDFKRKRKMSKCQINKSNTKCFFVLYWEIQELVQFISSSQVQSISMNSCLYFSVQNDKNFSIWIFWYCPVSFNKPVKVKPTKALTHIRFIGIHTIRNQNMISSPVHFLLKEWRICSITHRNHQTTVAHSEKDCNLLLSNSWTKATHNKSTTEILFNTLRSLVSLKKPIKTR